MKVAPSAGLSISTEHVVSAPDGNTINIQFIRPDNAHACRACTTFTAAVCVAMSCFEEITARGAG